MDIGIVLVFWIVVLGILAAVGAAVLFGLTFVSTRKPGTKRRGPLWRAALLPFASVVWAVAGFFIYAYVNDIVFDRDAGIGLAWSCPLPNGYAMLMVGTTNSAYVFNPGAQPDDAEQDDGVDGVVAMQVSGRYILGAAASTTDSGGNLGPVDKYVLMDTQAGLQRDFTRLTDLRAAAAPLHITPDLQPVARVYDRYRFTWFDAVAALAVLSPPWIGTFLLLLRALRLRRRQKA
ncbi:MAG TPA: hypothetical protein VHZ78_11060 [Rhizomicrobium sp.]|jgi:hypothetical protein|nr:hypothetical protein [Rhizomicrobium sp.]